MKLLKSLFFLFVTVSNSYSMQQLPAAIETKSDLLHQIEFVEDNESSIFRSINACLHDEIIAFINYQKSGTKWYISKIQTDSEYRSKGIAGNLFLKCFQDLKEINVSTVYWVVQPQENCSYSTDELVAWYEKQLNTRIKPKMPGSYFIDPGNYPIITYTFAKENNEEQS